MSYSFGVVRTFVITASVFLVGLAGAIVIAQARLSGVIAQRVRNAVQEREHLRGEVESIRVCVPCGSYTLEGPAFSVQSEGEWQPAFSAEKVVVSLLPASLLEGAPAGAVRLEAPLFHFRSQGGGSEADWSGIGAVLLPVPVDRLGIHGGRVELANRDLDPPVRWILTDVGLEGTNISRRESAPIEFDGEARMNGEGDIQARVIFPAGGGFQVEGTLRAVPVQSFNDYLIHALGVDVAAGTLDADGTVTGDDGGNLEGTIACRIDGLDVLDLDDVSAGDPLGLLWETFTASTLAAAGTNAQGAFEFEVEIRESVSDPRVNAWSLFGAVLRRSLVGLLESPTRALGWLARRVNPLAGD